MKNSKINIMSVFLEWKEDLKKGNIAIHYTDFNGILNILKSKRINKNWYDNNLLGKERTNFNHQDNDENISYDKNGKEYPIIDWMDRLDNSLSKEIRDRKIGEVALIRQSASPIKKYSSKEEINKMANIADKANLVAEIRIEINVLRNVLRGNKHTKISEYVIKGYRRMSFYIQKIENELNFLNKEILKGQIANRLNSLKQMVLLKNNKNINDLEKMFLNLRNTLFLLKEFKEADSNRRNEIKELFNDFKSGLDLIKEYSLEREGEERIDKDIPLSNKYMEIRLLETIFDLSSQEKRKIKNEIFKNKDLFLADATFNKFMKREEKSE